MTPTPPNPPRTITDDDSPLIRAIQDGAMDQFQDLVDRYSQSLYQFGMRMCRHPQDAEDLVQETFLNAYRYVGRFRFETRFKNWLFRIATSVCLKKRRRPKNAPEPELSLDDFLPQPGEPLPDHVPAWAAAPSDQLLNEELAATLRDAIGRLPDNYRLVVLLRDVEGFSTQETARILDLSESNVKVRLHRGRLFLRKELKAYFDHD